MIPTRAIVLAAGLGMRMRPLTEQTAKPLLPLGGRALLDHALDRLRDSGIEDVVVNTHWHAARVTAHLAGRAAGPRTHVRHEDTLLDTGGSVRAALGDLGAGPFFVVNGDSVWIDGPIPALGRLAAGWTDQADAVLLVHRTFQVHSEVGLGDFAIDPFGRVRRPKEREIVPYIYAGVQLVHPAAFRDTPDGAFSVNLVWDRLIAAGRLKAVVHDGLWFHLSSPPDLAEAETSLSARLLGESR